jgi:hypothetical protein
MTYGSSVFFYFLKAIRCANPHHSSYVTSQKTRLKPAGFFIAQQKQSTITDQTLSLATNVVANVAKWFWCWVLDWA